MVDATVRPLKAVEIIEVPQGARVEIEELNPLEEEEGEVFKEEAFQDKEEMIQRTNDRMRKNMKKVGHSIAKFCFITIAHRAT